MPPVEYKDCRQTAILWEANGTDSYGQPTHGTPVEIKVRWTWNRRDVRTRDDSTVTLVAIVKTLRDIPVGSLLWLGTIREWYRSGSAGNDVELCTVYSTRHSPDIRDRNMLRIVDLMRYKDSV